MRRFLITGGAAFFVDAGFYYLFVGSWGYFYAKGFSFIMGTIFAYIINKFWTFGSKKLCVREVVKFILLYTVSAYVNASVNHYAVYRTASLFFSLVAATGVSMVINFAGLKLFVFRSLTKTETVT